jgi:hypothetical protein
MGMQVCCGPDMMIYSSSVRWPGRINDARVFESSNLKVLMEGCDRGVILGDSAYPLREYLLTPIRNPTTPAQEAFNTAHKKTRNLIERNLGVIKARFCVLHEKLRMFWPESNVKIIVACLVLHNIAIKHHDYVDPLAEKDKVIRPSPNVDESRAGKIKRNHILRQYFGGRDTDMQRV